MENAILMVKMCRQLKKKKKLNPNKFVTQKCESDFILLQNRKKKGLVWELNEIEHHINSSEARDTRNK